jgi:small-conductance mechanosensitive channel
VKEILLEVARRHPDVNNLPAPDVIFAGFGDSSLDFELRIWTTKQVQTPKIIASDLYFAIFKAFHEAGVEIPFPQRDLHLKSVSGAAQSALGGPPQARNEAAG